MSEAVAEAAVPVESATKARDARVLEYLGTVEGGATRKQVVAFIHESEPGTSASQGYLTLNRLKAAGKVTRAHVDGEHRWSVAA